MARVNLVKTLKYIHTTTTTADEEEEAERSADARDNEAEFRPLGE